MSARPRSAPSGTVLSGPATPGRLLRSRAGRTSCTVLALLIGALVGPGLAPMRAQAQSPGTGEGSGATWAPEAPVEVPQVLSTSVSAPLSLFAPAERPSLDDVVASTLTTHPALAAARAVQEGAAGASLAADGAFDLNLLARGTFVPIGYYPSVRLDLMLEQPTPFWGLTAFGGYRLGVGDFASYYGERRTLSLGELNAGLRLPWLRDRAIDRARAARMAAELGESVARASLDVEIVRLARSASEAWLRWEAASARLAVAESVLELAELRDAQLGSRVAAGSIPAVEQVENQRVLLDRQQRVVAARREVERASVALSLFWRTPEGVPRLAPVGAIEGGWTDVPADLPGNLPQWLDEAMELRPELARLLALAEQAGIRAEVARNTLLPRLDTQVGVTADFGSGDAEFESALQQPSLEAIVTFQVPLQRRAARGERVTAQSEQARLQAELQQQQERIATELQDAWSAHEAARQRAAFAREGVDIAQQLIQAELQRFEAGATTLLIVNLREQAWVEAQDGLISAVLDARLAEVALDAAIARVLERTSR
jgi:cobalt-zinc-cadmium efflux system outer membrane protein